MGFGQGVAAAATFLLSVAFARLVSSEVYGQYQFVLAIMAMASVAALPGMNLSILQSAAKGKDGSYWQAVITKLWWSGWGSFLLIIGGGYYYWNDNYLVGQALFLGAVFLPLAFAFNGWNSFLEGKKRFDKINIYLSAQSLVNLAAMVAAMVFLKDNLLVLVAIYLLAEMSFNWFWFKRSLILVDNNETDGELIVYGKFLTKIQLLARVTSQLDKVFLGMLATPADLAVYAVGTNFSRVFIDKINSITTVFRPVVANQERISLKTYLSVFLVFAILALVVFLLLPVIIPLVFSDKYTESVALSQIVIVFAPFAAINLLQRNHFLLNKKNKKVLFWEAIVFPILKIGLMIVLFIFWGVAGLAFLLGFQHVVRSVLLLVLSSLFADPVEVFQ